MSKKYIKKGKFSAPKYAKKSGTKAKISKPSGKSTPYSSKANKILSKGSSKLKSVVGKAVRYVSKPYRTKLKSNVKKAKSRGIINVAKQKRLDARVKKGLPI